MDQRQADQIVRQAFVNRWDEIVQDQGKGLALRQAYAAGQIRTMREVVDRLVEGL